MQKRIAQDFPVYKTLLFIYNFFYYIATLTYYISIYISRLYYYVLYIALKKNNTLKVI